MIDREQILRKAIKLDDRIVAAKLLDKAMRTYNSDVVMHSDFLDPYQKALVQKMFTGCDEINYLFDGGYAGAEREIVVFCPDYAFFDELEYIDFLDRHPLSVVEVKGVNLSGLTHRDYLGALMGLGIKREKIGDILVKENGCSIFVLADIAEYINYNLAKIGNSKVTADIGDINEVELPDSKVRDINTTVASLRLDCIASAGFGISRSRIVDYIRAQKVNLNWEMTDSLTKQVKEGDTISIKGKGRAILTEVGKTTKKGRVSVKIQKLV